MPQADMPWVRNGQLVTASGLRLRLDTDAWFAWLSTARAFCYSGQPPALWRMTVRAEKRRQQTYWYGYARHDRKLHNVYLGKTESLTQTCLEAGCDRLAQRAQKHKEVTMPPD